MTTTKEDYLVEMYRLYKDGQHIGNKQISGALGVSAPSVTEMLVTLQNNEYIEYQQYKGSKLTKKGWIWLLMFCVDTGCESFFLPRIWNMVWMKPMK